MECSATLDGYTLGRKLGSGFSCKVRKASNASGNFAIKLLRKIPEDSPSHKSLQLALAEAQALLKLDHPNIVKLYEFKENSMLVKPNKKIPVAYLVFELVACGELFDYVALSGPFSEGLARHFFRQLVEALSFMHSKGYSHRDVKAENLLLDSNYNLKLADFGFSTPVIGHDDSGQLYSCKGSPNYMAPELFSKKPYIGQKVDLFAAGVLLFIMVARHPPFKVAAMQDARYKLFCFQNEVFWKKMAAGKPEGTFSTEFKGLVNEMLAFNPSMRPSVAEVKLHPWYNGSVMTQEEATKELSERHAKLQVQWNAKMEEALARKAAKRGKMIEVSQELGTRSNGVSLKGGARRTLKDYSVFSAYVQ